MKKALLLFAVLLTAALGLLWMSVRHVHVDGAPAVTLDIDALRAAIEAYRLEYGHLPHAASTTELQNARTVIAILTASPDTATTPASNPRQIKFLALEPARVRGNTFADPWGSEYHISLDLDGDGSVSLSEKPSARAPVPVAVWSSGPNRQNEFGEGDDIVSWRK